MRTLPSWKVAVLLTQLLPIPSAWAETAQPAAQGERVAVSQGGESKPYLTGAETPDMHAVLPPPPAAGSAAEAADRAAFQATRALKDTPRWVLAIHDADAKPKVLLSDFACALGLDLGSAETPRLQHLLGRTLGDVEIAFRAAKGDIKRQRPLVGNDLPICVPRDERLTESYSYPSGHATRGWVFALLLAELVPDKATAVLQRGRVYGESRVVCGAHFPTDVEAGRTVGAALVAALHGNAAFRSDLDAARAEVAALRSPPPSPPVACAAEAEAASTPMPMQVP